MLDTAVIRCLRREATTALSDATVFGLWINFADLRISQNDSPDSVWSSDYSHERLHSTRIQSASNAKSQN